MVQQPKVDDRAAQIETMVLDCFRLSSLRKLSEKFREKNGDVYGMFRGRMRPTKGFIKKLSDCPEVPIQVTRYLRRLRRQMPAPKQNPVPPPPPLKYEIAQVLLAACGMSLAAFAARIERGVNALSDVFAGRRPFSEKLLRHIRQHFPKLPETVVQTLQQRVDADSSARNAKKPERYSIAAMVTSGTLANISVIAREIKVPASFLAKVAQGRLTFAEELQEKILTCLPKTQAAAVIRMIEESRAQHTETIVSVITRGRRIELEDLSQRMGYTEAYLKSALLGGHTPRKAFWTRLQRVAPGYKIKEKKRYHRRDRT